jgi:uncharacterized RmlC-like cupin family protein
VAEAPLYEGRALSRSRFTPNGQPAQSAVACHVLRAGESFVGKQGFTYAPAISSESGGASPCSCDC